MKLTITTPIPIKSHCYKFAITFMIGDADGSVNEVVYVDEDSPYLERFAEFLAACKNKKNSRNCYEIKDYSVFVEGQDSDEDPGFYLEWGQEPYSGEPASLESVVITYFDLDGVEFNVEYES